MESLTPYLTERGYRTTRTRKRIFLILMQSDRPLSIRSINAKAPDLDRISIYRTINLFVKVNIIEVVPIGWKKHYELANPFKPHHHHLYCTVCHELLSINEKVLEDIINSIAAKNHYTLSSHHIELQGLCSHCRHKQKSAR